MIQVLITHSVANDRDDIEYFFFQIMINLNFRAFLKVRVHLD
jgi:hypothetical protein